MSNPSDASEGHLDALVPEPELVYRDGVAHSVRYCGTTYDLTTVAAHARLLAVAYDEIKRLHTNLAAFAGQLQAWGYDAAAESLLSEVVGGNVSAPDYYALQSRVRELEQAADERTRKLTFMIMKAVGD